MRQPFTRTIDGLVYEVTPMPAGVGVQLFGRILKIVGPALGDAASISEAAAEIGSALSTLTERLEPEELERILRKLTEHSRVEVEAGSDRFVALKDCFDLHFAGNYLALMQWARFALEANYGPFLRALVNAGASAQNGSASAAQSKSESLRTSPGPSIGSP